MRTGYFVNLGMGLCFVTGLYGECGKRMEAKFKALESLFREYHFHGMGRKEALPVHFPIVLTDALDPGRLLFLEEEAAALRQNAERFLSGGDACHFYAFLKEMYISARRRSALCLQHQTAAAFDFDLDETYGHTYLYKKPFCGTEAEFNDRWRRELKFRTGMRMIEMGDTARLKGVSLLPLHELEEEGRRYAGGRMACRLGPDMSETDRTDEYLTETVLNAYAQSWDPHSNFFSEQTMDVFNARLSREELSFGLSFEKDNREDLVIARIVPGGPAWKSNQLHEGDKVLAIVTEEGDLLRNLCDDPDDIMDKLTFARPSSISLDIRKVNGTLISVSLSNAVMEVEDNIVKSYILDGDGKVGYIALPGFYSEWNGSGVIGCASDVAGEIIQLKRSGITGLILDLRFNGGGSVDEALELVGIFIDEGPFCLVSDGREAPFLMKDPNRGLVYDGPLVVMINELSASAAELAAAVLKDYNRAVVVGSRSYGKATGQIVLPLGVPADAAMTNRSVDSSLGFVKLTTGLFYNLSEQTYQAHGVEPHIAFPELYRSFFLDEASSPQVIRAPVLEKKVAVSAMPQLPVDGLQSRYNDRHQNDTLLRQLQADIRYLYDWYYASRDLSLKLSSLEQMDAALKERVSRLNRRMALKTTALTISHHAMEESVLAFDDERKKTDDAVKQQLTEDLYLFETYLILADLRDLSR